MKRKLLTFLVALFMMFTITSCDVYTYATTQDDIYVETDADVVRSNVSFDVIIQYGIPYYRNGTLLYYLYNDIYYYPFYYNNYWYVRAYRRPFTHFDTRPYFRPHRYDYRFSPGHYKGYDRPRNSNVHHNYINPRPNPTTPNRHPNNVRPNNQSRQSRPIIRNERNVQTRTPNVRSNPNGHFGGSRGRR